MHACMHAWHEERRKLSPENIASSRLVARVARLLRSESTDFTENKVSF